METTPTFPDQHPLELYRPSEDLPMMSICSDMFRRELERCDQDFQLDKQKNDFFLYASSMAIKRKPKDMPLPVFRSLMTKAYQATLPVYFADIVAFCRTLEDADFELVLALFVFVRDLRLNWRRTGNMPLFALDESSRVA